MDMILPFKGRFCLVHIVTLLYMTADMLLDISIQIYIVHAVCISSDRVKNTNCIRQDYNKTVEHELQSEAAFYMTLNRIIINGPSIVLLPFYGSWSDKNGRRLPMALPCYGAFMAVVLYYISFIVTKFKMGFLLIGSAVHGIFGGKSLVRMATKSYVADMSCTETKSSEISIVVGLSFFGELLGILISGTTYHFSDFRVVSYVALALYIPASVFICFMTESITYVQTIPCSSSDADNESCGKCNTAEDAENTNVCADLWNQLTDCLNVLTKVRKNRQRKIICILFVMVFLTQLCRQGEWDVTVLFVKRRPFVFEDSTVSFLLGTETACKVFIAIVLVPIVTLKFGVPVIMQLCAATVCLVARYIWAGFMDRVWMIWVNVVFGSVVGVNIVNARSLLCENVSANEIGKLFSLTAIAECVSKTLGTPISVHIYSSTVRFLPGFVYLWEAMVFLAVLAMSCVLYRFLLKPRYDGEYVKLENIDTYGTTDDSQTDKAFMTTKDDKMNK